MDFYIENIGLELLNETLIVNFKVDDGLLEEDWLNILIKVYFDRFLDLRIRKL